MTLMRHHTPAPVSTCAGVRFQLNSFHAVLVESKVHQ